MDHSRHRPRPVPALACLALVLGLLVAPGSAVAAAGGDGAPVEPTAGSTSATTPSDPGDQVGGPSDAEDRDQPAEPTAPPAASLDDVEPDAGSSAEPASPTAEQSAGVAPSSDLRATQVSVVRSAGTTTPQEPVRGRVLVRGTDGTPVTGVEVTIVLAGPSPRRQTLRTTSAGSADYSFDRLRSGSYTLQAEVVADDVHAASQSPALPIDVQAGRYVSLLVNSGYGTRVVAGENFWLRGRVLDGRGAPDPGTTVRIYRYSGSGRTKVATVRTGSSGGFAWSPQDRRTGTYRAQVSSVRFSAKQAVRAGGGTRTLGQRATSLGFLLGAPTSDVRAGGGRTWRTYERGTLVQTGARTWLVRGTFLEELASRGGPGGSLGAPTGDVRCGLPEGGCLQQFRTGAIYGNPKAKDTLTSAVSPTLGAADLLAVARSQVGYREPQPRKSKYNRWIGRTGKYDPWCGFFVSWLAHAGGKPGSVIKATSFKKLLDAERKRGRTSRTPKVGRLAYIGYFSKGTASHVGIVTQVSSTHVWTIEGNVSAGGGMKHPRGVHVVKRPKSRIVFYADPRY